MFRRSNPTGWSVRESNPQAVLLRHRFETIERPSAVYITPSSYDGKVRSREWILVTPEDALFAADRGEGGLEARVIDVHELDEETVAERYATVRAGDQEP